MQEDIPKILAECLVEALTEWYMGDQERFQYYCGKMDNLMSMINKFELDKDDLIGGLEQVQFTEQLASKILGG